MKIGYSISTTPARFDPARDYFEHCAKDSVCHLHNDVQGLGMATAKNRAIKTLYDLGCDVMILMDDDTRILGPEFTELLIRAHEVTGIHHFTIGGSAAIAAARSYEQGIRINQHLRGSGVMLFITRKVVEKVGYLNVNYPGKWGHAHIGWSIRILKAGLMKPFKGWRLAVDGIEKYFYSEDLHAPKSEANPAENFTQSEKNAFMVANAKEHARETRSTQLYYPYAERKPEAASHRTEAVPA